jgi:iron-regulated transporter 1
MASEDDESPAPSARIDRGRTEWQLYTSHFLSMWNSRLFEFGAVLFLASIFPSTLSPMSIYALVRSSSAILFAQQLGRWIDNGNRLTVVRVSILGQRLAVALSCGVLWVMESRAGTGTGGLGVNGANALFAVLVALACVEKLCATMNTIAIERDWVGISNG